MDGSAFGAVMARLGGSFPRRSLSGLLLGFVALVCSESGEAKTCPKRKRRCGSRCVDPKKDKRNCGRCGVACAAGSSCRKGRCVCDPACVAARCSETLTAAGCVWNGGQRRWECAGSMREVDLRGCSLNGARFTGIDMVRANFAGASLIAAYFGPGERQVADFTGANLTTAYFRDAFVQNASFRGADLGGVTFDHSAIYCADFLGADLSGAKFLDTEPCRTRMPDGSIGNRTCSLNACLWES